jgi:hypothetical protein
VPQQQQLLLVVAVLAFAAAVAEMRSHSQKHHRNCPAPDGTRTEFYPDFFLFIFLIKLVFHF